MAFSTASQVKVGPRNVAFSCAILNNIHVTRGDLFVSAKNFVTLPNYKERDNVPWRLFLRDQEKIII
jgi:hypothetical protein